jgi:hypothetical protein
MPPIPYPQQYPQYPVVQTNAQPVVGFAPAVSPPDNASRSMMVNIGCAGTVLGLDIVMCWIEGSQEDDDSSVYFAVQDQPSLLCAVIFFSLLLAHKFQASTACSPARGSCCCSSQSKIIAALIFEFIHFGISIWTSTDRTWYRHQGRYTYGYNDDNYRYRYSYYYYTSYNSGFKMGVGIPAVLLLFVGMIFQLYDLCTRGAKQSQHRPDDDVPLISLSGVQTVQMQ